VTKNRKLKKFFAFWGENFKKMTFGIKVEPKNLKFRATL